MGLQSVLLGAINDLNLNGLPQPQADANAFRNILTIVLGIVGAICLLFITIGGFRYILSQGDPQAVSKAKGTIVYALVGLVIVIIAQSIVVFVVQRVR